MDMVPLPPGLSSESEVPWRTPNGERPKAAQAPAPAGGAGPLPTWHLIWCPACGAHPDADRGEPASCVEVGHLRACARACSCGSYVASHIMTTVPRTSWPRTSGAGVELHEVRLPCPERDDRSPPELEVGRTARATARGLLLDAQAELIARGAAPLPDEVQHELRLAHPADAVRATGVAATVAPLLPPGAVLHTLRCNLFALDRDAAGPWAVLSWHCPRCGSSLSCPATSLHGFRRVGQCWHRCVHGPTWSVGVTAEPCHVGDTLTITMVPDTRAAPEPAG